MKPRFGDLVTVDPRYGTAKKHTKRTSGPVVGKAYEVGQRYVTVAVLYEGNLIAFSAKFLLHGARPLMSYRRR